MRPELVVVDGEVVAVRLAGQEFPCEPEALEAIIPKSVLTGFKLSEIPEELTIKPVESITGSAIEVENDIGLSSYASGSAFAVVEVMFRRKHWDGDVGLSSYIDAYRKAIFERHDTEESDFQDDGDYVILRYDIKIEQDLEVEDAIKQVESVIAVIEKRTDQITLRKLDALTNIFDRGSFDADLAHALDSPQSNPLSLLIIDLDKFKTINDTYDHEAGDEVLTKAANVVRLACEGKGSCFRYGGDEMTVLLPRHNIQQASTIAEQIRVGIAELKFERCPENITASIGATSYPEVTKTSANIFSDADAMVYQAKDDGGNAVAFRGTFSVGGSMAAPAKPRRHFLVEIWDDKRELFKILIGDAFLFLTALFVLFVVFLFLRGMGKAGYSQERLATFETLDYYAYLVVLVIFLADLIMKLFSALFLKKKAP